MFEDNLFPVNGIEILFQQFKPIAYAQAGSPSTFIPFLSILDSLFNIGPISTALMIEKGTSQWVNWSEMIMLKENATNLKDGWTV